MINNPKMMSNGCGFLQKLQKLSLIFTNVTNELFIDMNEYLRKINIIKIYIMK